MYGREAIQTQAKQQLGFAKTLGLQDHPYYDRFKSLAQTGNIYDYLGGGQGLTGGGGGGGGGGVVGGAGRFIGGTTGVLPGFLQYQNSLNAQGQGQMLGQGQMPLHGHWSQIAPDKISAIKKIRKGIVDTPTPMTQPTPQPPQPTVDSTRATAAYVNEQGQVYGQGPVPGFGGNPNQPGQGATNNFYSWQQPLLNSPFQSGFGFQSLRSPTPPMLRNY